MRITAKLAYDQMRINRRRTVWTLLGIVLATALITAVCSFVASGNALLVHIYGADYGEQGGKYFAMLLVPAAILSIIIMSMAVVVISNAFRVSASERKAQFGILKSVGTTKKQITETVMYESVFFSILGIPVGIMVGFILTFLGIRIANHYFGEWNSLVHLMMDELTIVLDFVISWQAILAAIMISFLTTLLSAWLPARKAARITAIDSIRNVDEIQLGAKKMQTNPLTERLFGVEGALAAKNMKRSKRNFRASVISLTMGVVLFICLGSLDGQLDKMVEYMYSYSNTDIKVDYVSSYETRRNEKTGKEQNNITAPIDSTAAENITAQLRAYKGATIFGSGMDNITYTAVIPDKRITPEMKTAVFTEEKSVEDGYEVEVEIITVDNTNYALLCEAAGVPIGSNILINHYEHNEKGNAITTKPFHLKGEHLQLIKADDSTEEVTIHGELPPEKVPKELLGPGTGIFRLIVPEGMMRGYAWDVRTDDINGFIKYANTTMDERFPEDGGSGYMEQGFSTRVFKWKDYIKVMNLAINLAMVFVQSFVILMTLIGLTNVVSTMSANVQIRSREFAVLQSIGMTKKGVQRMIVFESVSCSVKSLLIGLPLALILTYFINIPIRQMLPIPYEFPVGMVLCCIIAVFGITGGTMWYSSTRLGKYNIIETIRLDG